MAAIRPVRPLPTAQAEAPVRGEGAGDFRSLMEAVIGKVEQARAEANQAVESFLAGEGGELHSVALATQRAELALELFLQARNKVMQAYQEIMRMPM
jgi:flagellar hook-basal body complex protein FliE